MFPSILSALDALPGEIKARSGSIFYSGRAAFHMPSDLYILGLNPGGSPDRQADETVGGDIEEWQRLPERESWSAYIDACWDGSKAGRHGLQPRVLHMFKTLGRDLRAVPASNVLFLRSATEATLVGEKMEMLRTCWPVHQAVIDTLSIRTILCFGASAAHWVRNAIGAHRPGPYLQERNRRGWTNATFFADDGRCIVQLTHPGRADWTNPLADPTSLVREILDR